LAILQADVEILLDPAARDNADERFQKRVEQRRDAHSKQKQRHRDRSLHQKRSESAESNPNSEIATDPNRDDDAKMAEVAPSNAKKTNATKKKGSEIDWKAIKMEVVSVSLVPKAVKSEVADDGNSSSNENHSSHSSHEPLNFKAFKRNASKPIMATQANIHFEVHHSERLQEEAAFARDAQRERQRVADEKREKRKQPKKVTSNLGRGQRKKKESGFTAVVPSGGRTEKNREFWAKVN
jgi:hypothetical protein